MPVSLYEPFVTELSMTPPTAIDDIRSGEEVMGDNNRRSGPITSAVREGKLSDATGRLPPFPLPWRQPLQSASWLLRTLFGLASLILLLAVIAAIPLINILALGYLLEVEGRIGRSGRLRDAFPLLNVAPRLGSIALGIWLWLLPLRFLAGVAADAAIIDPGGTAAERIDVLVAVAWGLVTAHICLALARGGSLTCFFRPIKKRPLAEATAQ